MTYLELVNHVLKRLRERTVSTVNQTTYSSMVGEFVNDAKDLIEEAWAWSMNREVISKTTVAGTSLVTLNGFGRKGRILSAWNDTSNGMLSERPQGWLDSKKYTGEVPQGSPSNYVWRGVAPNNNMNIEVYPTPDDTYTLQFNCYVPNYQLLEDTDEITVPWQPVVMEAVAMLAEEKGEAGGTTSARYFQMANKSLSDAIAIDANRFPAELNFYEV